MILNKLLRIQITRLQTTPCPFRQALPKAVQRFARQPVLGMGKLDYVAAASLPDPAMAANTKLR